MGTTCESKQAGLLKKFHTLCSKNGLSQDQKTAMVSAFGVESSRDLNVMQLQHACDALGNNVKTATSDLDVWRKRVMASVGAWLRLIAQPQNGPIIKAIACRVTKHENFNDIPKERLVNVYYLFLQKQKDFKAVDGFAKEELENLTYLN